MAMNKRYMVTMKRSCSCSMPGVWGAVAHNQGAVVIFHSPKACGHVSSDMELGSHYHSIARQSFIPKQYTAPLITSNLQEEHSIFGGTEQLRRCIDYVVKQYQPEYIMVANSCVVGVIGDDTESIIQEAEEEWNIPIMTVPCSGFLDGEYYAGFYHAAKILSDRFMSKQPTHANTVALLGGRGGPNSTDGQEIQQLLESFGLLVHCHFPGYASLEEIRRVTASALCIPLGGRRSPSSFSMQQLAIDIQAKFGIPFLDHNDPIGWKNTQSWIRKLGELLRLEQKAKMIVQEQNERLQQQVIKCRGDLQAIKVVMCIGRPLLHFQPEWVLELLELAGVNIEGIILFSGLTGEQKEAIKKKLKKYTIIPVLEEDEGEAMIEGADILITTHELEDEAKRQFFLPVLPPLGVGGLIHLLNKLARLARRSAHKGGVLYGW
ncbi:nitrogenase component 1 [Pelosinus sp. sgz500959]|uniref:nitrogenase component 1 n=1 Tax=Pelosinus sp. sgz500959 TaxID=3242472 RepID=UPI00366E62D3